MGAVVVAGSINMDVVAYAPRLPTSGETVLGTGMAFFPGGKGANQAVAAARAGAGTRIVEAVGDDAFGGQLVAFLKSQNVNTDAVRQVPGAASGAALIAVAEGGENLIVVAPGANSELSPEDVRAAALNKGDVLVCQFEVPPATVRAALEYAKRAGATSVLNPAPAQPFDALGLADVLILNESELQLLAGSAGLDAPAAAAALRTRVQAAVVATLGADGAVAVTDAGTLSVPGRRVTAVDATGAGDCFVGSVAAELAAGAGLEQALAYANAAAAICVQRPGAGPAMPNRAEVLASL